MSKRRSSSATSINSGGVVLCEHNVPAVVKTSGTSTNPGRQFYGCPYWQNVDGKQKCRFFRWVERIDDGNQDLEAIIIQLEDALRLAESKAERRKNEKNALIKDMVAQGRRLNDDIRAIRLMIGIVIVSNVFFLLFLWRNQTCL
ncbi:unnamed protein product [Linum trigynum]|uniref:GRF-type domain-containing protein n=1 Tax=Linum trigynum TaxID=586398 RepID=A0AAV2EZA8_9ROSI